MMESAVLQDLKKGSPLTAVHVRTGNKLVQRLFFLDVDLWAWCSLVPSTRRRDLEGGCRPVI